MILDTTYKNKSNKQLINDLIGKPFSFFQKIKLKGVNSKKLIIDNTSDNLKPYLNTTAELNYTYIELRPKGILIRLNKGVKTFIWIIPFYQLIIYKVNGSSIHAQGRFVHFKNKKTLRENNSFFKKILDRKVLFDEQYNFN